MSVYKPFKPQDYAVVPFNAHKQYDFTSASAAANKVTYQTTFYDGDSPVDQYTSDNIKYSQLEHLFYRNYVTDLVNKFGDVNYLKHKRVLYEKANVMSIPSGLYGHKINPGSFFLSDNGSSTIIVDDSYGNLLIKDTNIDDYITDPRSILLDISAVEKFKYYSYLNSHNQFFNDLYYKKGQIRVNSVEYYNTPSNQYEYDDSYFLNKIHYNNINFDRFYFNAGSTNKSLTNIIFNGSNSEIKSYHDSKFNFNPGDDFSIEFWAGNKTLMSKATASIVLRTTNNIIAGTPFSFFITSSDGTIKQYIPTDSFATGELFNNTFGTVSYDISEGTTVLERAQALKAAIESPNGHNSKIEVNITTTSITGDTLLLTQAVKGVDGNTTITYESYTLSTDTFGGGALMSPILPSSDSTFGGGSDTHAYLISKSTTKTEIPSTTESENSYQLKETPAGQQYPFEVYIKNDTLYFERSDGDITSTVFTDFNISSSQHVICSVSSSTMQLYINGELKTTQTNNTIKRTQNKANLYIGNQGGNSKYYSGSLSQIKIYDKPFNSTKALNHYNSINGSPYIGNIFYSNGLITITHPKYNNILNFTSFGIGTMTVDNDNQAESIFTVGGNNNSFTINKLKFQGSHLIYENEYQCKIDENEYNHTLNPSVRKLKTIENSELEDFTTGSLFKPYITTIGLYNKNNELLVVGKLGQPLRTSNETDTTLIVKWDT